MQISIAHEIEGMPEFRRVVTDHTSIYVEGWALYAEWLGYELGLFEKPEDEFGALTAEMWRAIRLVVDTGIHWLGWSRERSIEYFLENCSKNRVDVENEVDRYATMPGQAVAYKIGELRIKQLRKDAERRLGPAFDVRDFHRRVLEHGPLPMSTLERMVKA